MQLDLFEHSQDIMARNAVAEALLARNHVEAMAALATLQTQFPDESQIPSLRLLCKQLTPPLDDPEALIAQLADRDAVITAANRVFGKQAYKWLFPWYEQYANALGILAFDPANECVHSAGLMCRAGNWQSALDYLQNIPTWHHQPAPLSWAITAKFNLDGFDAAWPLLVELCWIAPTRATELARQLEFSALSALIKKFDAQFETEGEESGFAYFPAWVMIESPSWAVGVRQAERSNYAAPERCARLIVNLLTLEREGRHRELIDTRQRLRNTHEGLFRLYMSTR